MRFRNKRFIFLVMALAAWSLQGAEEVRPCAPVNPGANILKGITFTYLKPPTEQEKKKLDEAQVTLEGNGIPPHWKFKISGNPKNTKSVFRFEKMDGHGVAHANCPENTWNGVQLMMRQGVKSQAMRDGKHTLGIWAKGNGTLTLEVLEFVGSRQVASTKVAFLVTEKWDFYRSEPLALKHKDSDRICVSISAYGNISFAVPEVAPIATPDAVAELVFYLPFDRGASKALFSVGATGAFGASDASGIVPGVAGDALRLDSRRRFTPLGVLRLPMGRQYMHLADVLPREEGTLEFWFRPLQEHLDGKKWSDSPLFKIGNSASSWMWPDSEDISLFIRKVNGALQLEYREHEKFLRYPDQTPVKIQQGVNEQKRAYPIKDTSAFIGKWHHLALTWTKKSRRLYMDGVEVISVVQDKSPVIFSRKPSLYLGCTALSQPFIASCDFDELKIYRRCRYREGFTPRIKVPGFKRIENVEIDKASSALSPLTLSSMKIAGQGVEADWKNQDEKYRIRLEIGDGLPLVYSTRNAANTVLAPNYPEIMPLQMRPVLVKDNEASGELGRRDASFVCRIDESQGRLVLTVTLKRGEKEERVYLEPRITLENLSNILWTNAYDGFTERPLLLPFCPFAFQDLQTALPLAGAWNRRSGMVLALSPEGLASYLSRGMSASNQLCLKLRTVLDAGESVTWRFEIFRVTGKYGSDAMVDAYHGAHPEYFALSPEVDPRLYSNIAQTNIWNSAAYRKRKEQFSLSEISRRVRGRWCWYYWTGAATGNWSVDQELLSDFAPLNEPRVGDGKYSRTVSNAVKRESEKIRLSGINPSLYISSWADKRLATNYRDSRFDAGETENGIYFWANYWCRGVTDYIMLPSGGRYGGFLRRQIDNMLRDYPGTNCFSHDLFGGDYYFRKETSLGGLRAFDEDGMYAHNLAAMGRFLDDLRTKKGASSYRTAVIGNGHAQVASFNTFFRADNTIHERSLTWTLQDWTNLNQQSKLLGAKPSTFYEMPSLLGNYMDAEKDSPELIRYSLVALQHSQLLMGMLYNVNVNWSVLGVREAIPMIDELLRVHSLGYRVCKAFDASPELGAVRYGTPAAGALVLVNLSPKTRHSSIRPDAEYLHGMPLLARSGAELKVSQGQTEVLAVPPLGWSVVDMLGSIQGEVPEYVSRLERGHGGRTISVTFVKDADLKGLKMRLGSEETPLSVTRNKENMPFSLKEGVLEFPRMSLRSGDILQIVIADRRWHAPLADAIGLSFENATVCAAPSLNGEAERIVEFFRFWGANQMPKRSFGVTSTEKPDEKTRCILECSGKPMGIYLENGRIVIRGRDERQVADCLEEYLAALESRYPYMGLFGNQMPVYDWDYATTGEQRRLLKKSGIVQTLQSSENVSLSIGGWLEKQPPDAADGF